MTFRNRFRLFLNVIAIVGALILTKVTIHQFNFEFLSFDGLLPSVVASAIFIIGFLLSSILPDYKEAERIPAEIRMALEAIHDDVVFFVTNPSDFDIPRFRRTLSGLVVALENGLGPKGAHSDLEAAIAQADKLSPVFARLEQLGMSQNFVARLRDRQDLLRKSLYRVYYIQKMEFLPSVHVLIQTLVVATLSLLLFLKTDGSFGSAFVFGFVSYMFVYALHLVDVLEQPFRKGAHSLDDVSLFLLRDFARKIDPAGIDDDRMKAGGRVELEPAAAAGSREIP